MLSGALQEYFVTLALPTALLTLEEGYEDPPQPNDAQTVEALRGGAIVLMVAAFERYLSAVLAEHLGRLSGDTPPIVFNRLPQKLQVESVYSGLNRAMSGPRHGESGEKEERLPEIIKVADRVAQGRLNVDALAETRGNPGSARVKEMLNCIAMADPFTRVTDEFGRRWDKAEAIRFVQDKLDDIVTKRHAVAHQADALNVTRGDLRNGLRFLRVLGETLDAVIGEHIKGLIEMGAVP